MDFFDRSRTLGSPSRMPSSKSYKVDLAGRRGEQALRLTINVRGDGHQSAYLFHADELSGRRSIHFAASQDAGEWTIVFSGVRPFGVVLG